MKNIILALSSIFFPSLVFAQSINPRTSRFNGTMDLIFGVANIIDGLTVLAVGAALLIFFWGLVKFILKAGEGDVEEGKKLMIWGTIALFVIVSIWGLVRFIQGELLPGGDYSDVVIPGFN